MMAKVRFTKQEPSFGDLMEQVYSQSARQIRTEIVVKDISAIIQRIPLKQEELVDLYNAVASRFKSKTCARCGRLTVDVIEGGELNAEWASGHIYSRKFICNACQQVLKEKSLG